MDECALEEVAAESVGVEEGAEEPELVFAKLVTGGRGNVYSICGLKETWFPFGVLDTGSE